MESMLRMAITVRFIGAFRNFSRKTRFTIQTEKTITLRELINKTAKAMPRLEKALIDSELEDPRPNALIIVNGKEISILNGLKTKIKDGDEVVFIPVLHGG